MQLSRLQRIYHSRNVAYDELEESLTTVPTDESKPKPISFHVIARAMKAMLSQHGFRLRGVQS